MPIRASTDTNVRNECDAWGNSERLNRIRPYAPIFRRTAARITEPAVGASVWASGSQVWSGNSGTFTANATKKARNSHRAVEAGSDIACSWVRSNVLWPSADADLK